MILRINFDFCIPDGHPEHAYPLSVLDLRSLQEIEGADEIALQIAAMDDGVQETLLK